MTRFNIKEDKEANVTKFLHGLNHEIANVVELQKYIELEDMVYMAMKVERQLNKMSSSKYGHQPNFSWKPNYEKEYD